MASQEYCLKVTPLPLNITEDHLKIVFQNRRNQGGGPVEKINLYTNDRPPWALIHFRNPQAIDTILARGNTVTIDEQPLNVSRFTRVEIAQSEMIATRNMAQSRTKPQETKLPRLQEQHQKIVPSENFDHDEHMDYEESIETVARRTIKATVLDVYKTKDSYIYYLEDEEVSEGGFDEESLLLDCLNRVLYVTFEDEEGARKTCRRKHGKESNFGKVEMSSEADFDTYPNKVWVHGSNLKQRLMMQKFLEFVYRETRMRVQNVIQWNEYQSSILVFDEKECQDITDICWKLRTEFEGVKILSAPVFKTKSVSVSGLPPNFDKCLLRRYLSNPRSGGGNIDSLKWQDDVAIVTFKSEDHFFGVLQKKEHFVANSQMKIEAYYDCLSKSALARSFKSKGSYSEYPSPTMESPDLESAEYEHCEPDGKDIDEDEDETEVLDFSSRKEVNLDLERKDMIILRNTSIFDELKKKHRFVKFTLDEKSFKVKVQGEDSNVHKASSELLQMALRRFKSETVAHLSTYQLETLKMDGIQEEINREFQKGKKHAVFVMEGNVAYIYYVLPTDAAVLKAIVQNLVQEETKNFSDPNIKLLFSSKVGLEYLSGLSKAPDGSSSGILVKYDEKKNSLLMIAPHHKKTDLHNKIDLFLKENMMDVKCVKFSEGKVQYLNKYKKGIITDLKEKLRPMGVMIKENSNSFEVTGKKDEVASVEKELVKIRDSIFVGDFSLKFFGVKEFMSEKEGKRIKIEVENSMQCCIYSPTDFASDGDQRKSARSRGATPVLKPIPQPRSVAAAHLGGYVLHFVQGDLLGLEVEAIVNPIKESKNLSNVGSFSKAILDRGGDQIQTDLLRTADSELVTLTGSGRLDKCKNILHVVLQSFNSGEGSSIKTAVTDVLNHARKKHISSVGFPSLGHGKNFGYPSLTVCMQIMNAIKRHIEMEATSPGDIYLCDKSEEILSSLIGRCEQTFPDAFIEKFIEIEQKQKTGPVPYPRRKPQNSGAQPKDFGHLKVKVHQGEITKWKIDVIAIAVDKSLNLKRGTLAKLVLRFGGDTLQQELNNNYTDGIQPGEFAQSSGGNLKCENILYGCIAHCKSENGPEVQQMQRLVEKMLDAANNIPVTSIAFPALGTGNLKYPPDLVAQVFNNAISNFARNNPGSTLKTVDIVIYPQDNTVFDAFQSQMSDTAASPARGSRSRASNFSDNEEEEDDDNDNSSEGAVGFVKSALGKIASLLRWGPNNKLSYGCVTLTVSKGDLTMERCDGIVCSIKNSMDLSASGAVGNSLLKKCGSSLQAECTNQQPAMQQTGVAKTSASGLACQNIYFVSMEMFGEHWDRGVVEVLTQAETDGATSIALPLLGSGVKRPKMDMVQKKFLAGVEKFGKSRRSSSLKDIRLVIFSQDMYDFFTGKDERPSSPKMDKTKSPKESQGPQLKVSDRIDLKLYANDSSHAEKIKSSLIQAYRKEFKREQIKNDKIKHFNQKQVCNLEHTALETRVQIRVRLDDGVIDLASFFHMNKVMNKFSSLMVEAVENHLTGVPTAIVWQYKDKDDKWRNFEPLMNFEIEKAHKKSPQCIVSDSQNQSYQLDFKTMEEYSVTKDGAVSKQGIKIRRYDKTKGGSLPNRWASMDTNENLKMIPVKSGSEEFKHVEGQFRQGGVADPIKAIQRIQNKFLYQQYMAKKREMDQRNGKHFQNEKRLFHGTNLTSMAAINENGFSNNYSGAHATAYGDGTYFAVQSAYSKNYCQADSNGLKHMYLVRVLVGKSTQSSRGMKYLPNQPNTNTPFDSGTDGANVMFVIFHDAQTYPEYLISF